MALNSPLSAEFCPAGVPKNLTRGLSVAPAQLLSVQQVAEAMGVCTATVYTWCERLELPHIRIGNNMIRVATADLEAFIGRNRRK